MVRDGRRLSPREYSHASRLADSIALKVGQEHTAVVVITPGQQNHEETTMKLKTIALATAFALTSTFAFAQNSAGSSTSGAPAATGSTNGEATSPTGRPSGDAAMQKNMGTTGTNTNPNGAMNNGTSGNGPGSNTNSPTTGNMK
jgi:hypothetical protein